MKLRGGEFSTGTTGIFQPELTPTNCLKRLHAVFSLTANIPAII